MTLAWIADTALCLRLATTLAHVLWQATAVAAVAFGAAALARKAAPNARYLMMIGALLVMAVCPVATFALLGAPEPAGAALTAGPADGGGSPTDGVAAPAPLAVEPAAGAAPDTAPPVEEGSTRAAAEQGKERAGLAAWAPYVAAAYLAGVAAMLSRLLVGLHGGRRLRRASEPVNDATLLGILAGQAKRLGLRLTPAVAFCRRVAAPTVVGVLRPVVLLPLSFATGLSSGQVAAVLAHELAHVRRYDYLVNLAQRLVEALLFFHPAVWLVSRRARLEREHCCDDLALAAGADRLDYARSLVTVAERSLAGGHGPPAPAAVAATGKPSELRRRVERLVGADGPRMRLSRSWPLALVAAAVAALAVVSTLRVAAAPAEKGVNEDDAVLRELRKLVKIQQDGVERAKRLYKAGVVSQADLLTVEAALAQANLRLVRRRAELEARGGDETEATRAAILRALRDLVEFRERRYALAKVLVAQGVVSTAEASRDAAALADARIALARERERQGAKPTGKGALLRKLEEELKGKAERLLPGHKFIAEDDRIRIEWRLRQYDVRRPAGKAANAPLVVRRETGPAPDGLRLTLWLQDQPGQADRPQTLDNDGKWKTFLGIKPVPALKTSITFNLEYGPKTDWKLLRALAPSAQGMELKRKPPAEPGSLDEAAAALMRRAVALKPNSTMRPPRGDQSPTGLDFRHVLRLAGQQRDFESFSRDHRFFEGSANRLAAGKKTWALCALLDYPNSDAKVYTARALLKLADPQSVPAVLAAAKANNYIVPGSENATIHSMYRSTLKAALEKITGLKLTPKGLKVTTYAEPGKPKVVRSEDAPAFFKEEVDFKKVEDWLRGARPAKASTLEFRVVPNRMGSSRLPVLGPTKRYVDDLAANGPLAGRERGDELQWFEVGADFRDRSVTATHEGKTYVLLCGKAPWVMRRDEGGWGIVSARAQPGRARGTWSVHVQLDERGGRLFRQLTRANIGNAVALVVDGRVVSAPTVRSAIGQMVQITGRFEKAEAEKLAAALRKGMPPAKTAPRAKTSASKVLGKALAELLTNFVLERAKAGEMPKNATKPEFMVRFVQQFERAFPRLLDTTPEDEKRLAEGRFDDEGNGKRVAAAVKQLADLAVELPQISRMLIEQWKAGKLKGPLLELGARVLEGQLEMAKAEVRKAAGGLAPESATVDVDEAGGLRLEGEAVADPRDLLARLKKLGATPDTRIVIRASRQTPFAKLTGVLHALREDGFKAVQILTNPR